MHLRVFLLLIFSGISEGSGTAVPGRLEFFLFIHRFSQYGVFFRQGILLSTNALFSLKGQKCT